LNGEQQHRRQQQQQQGGEQQNTGVERCIIFTENGKTSTFCDTLSKHLTKIYSAAAGDANKGHHNNDPPLKFHIAVLESLLTHTIETLRGSTNSLLAKVDTLLPSQTNLNELLLVKNELLLVESSVNDIYSTLTALLSDDTDLNLLSTNGNLVAESHIDVELLLEDYLQQFEEILLAIRSKQEQVKNAESSLELTLDLTRNKILRFELLLSITSLAVSLGALVTGLFGMNLLSNLEIHPSMFWIVSAGIGVVMVGVWKGLIGKLRKDIKNSLD
jgi:Mg2+ and Co2+ transporter CorA